jgi:hypothetical protein
MLNKSEQVSAERLFSQEGTKDRPACLKLTHPDNAEIIYEGI